MTLMESGTPFVAEPARAPRAHPRTDHFRADVRRAAGVPAGPDGGWLLTSATLDEPVFGRSKTTAAEEATSSSVETKDGGKGRPTPKRARSSAAAAGRGDAQDPQGGSRRDARQAARERALADGRAQGRRRAQPAGPRPRPGAALRPRRGRLPADRRGVLPPARGPDPRAVVRGSDKLSLLGSALWLALVVLIVLDSVFLVVKLRRGLARTFPDEEHRGVVPYALMRSMQIRRFRLPPAALPGDHETGRTGPARPSETRRRYRGFRRWGGGSGRGRLGRLGGVADDDVAERLVDARHQRRRRASRRRP